MVMMTYTCKCTEGNYGDNWHATRNWNVILAITDTVPVYKKLIDIMSLTAAVKIIYNQVHRKRNANVLEWVTPNFSQWTW